MYCEILLQPPPDAVFQVIHVLEHDRPLGLLIEGEDGIAPKLDHHPA